MVKYTLAGWMLIFCGLREKLPVQSYIDDTDVNPVRAGKNLYESYGLIRAIIEERSAVLLKVDFIQLLTGASAVEAAKKQNKAETILQEDGSVTHSVPNDYFLLNRSKQSYILPISQNVQFELIGNLYREPPVKLNNLENLKSMYMESLFLLTIKNGQIRKVKEIYLP
ncbi:MAG TPA: hypothetical protein VGN63_04120 [Flavisolibacter sp.]|jgi:hypothetical protein|nr:hypothetical protein [Flavisolibacter sp.]